MRKRNFYQQLLECNKLFAKKSRKSGNAFSAAAFFAVVLLLLATPEISFAIPGLTFVNSSPQSLSVCENSGANNISSMLSVNDPTAGQTLTWSLSSGPSNGVVAAAYSVTSTSGTNTPVGLSYTPSTSFNGTDAFSVMVSNGTQTITATFNVTVNALPSVFPIPNQSLCNNQTTTAVDFSSTIAGTTYSWTNNNMNIGLGASGSGNNIASFTATDNFAAPITGTVTVTPANGTCAGSPLSFIFTVNPTPTVNAILDQTLCNSVSTTAINFTGNVAGTTYSWTNDNTSIGLGASGTNSIPTFTTTNTTNAPITGIIVVSPSANGCIGSPYGFSITVYPTTTTTSVSNQTLCNNSATVADTFTSDVPGTTYTWTNSNTTIGLAGSGSGNILNSFTAENSTSVTDTGVIIVTPSANSCAGTPDTFMVIVNPTPTVAPTDDTALCTGVNYSVSFGGSLVAGTTYAWTNSNTTIGLGTSGTNSTGTFTTTNTTNIPTTSIVTVTPQANSCNGAMSTFTIMVNPTPTVTVPSSENVCNGAATGNLNFGGTVSGTVYTWTNSNSTIGLASTGTNSIPSFAAINTGITTELAVITVTPSANGCNGAPQGFSLNIYPTPTVTTPDNQTICNNSLTTAIVFGGTVGFTQYSWTNSNTTIGMGASGTGNIASFTATNGTSVIDTAVITVTPTANECTGQPTSFMIIVDPTPNVVATNDETVCNGTTDSVSFSGAVTGTSYSWTNSNANIGLVESGTGTTLYTATSGINIADTGTIIVTPQANGCYGIPDTFTISVNPTPNVSATDDTSLCNATSYSVTFGGSSVTGTTYLWTNSNTTIGLPSSGTNTTGTITLTNGTSTTNTGTITVTPWASGCSGIPDTFMIAVYPTPTLSGSLAPPAICDNTVFSYGDTSLTAGTTFAWTMPTVAGISAPASSGVDSINEMLSNSTTAQAAVTFVYTLTANGCVNTQNVVVIVNPDPQLSSPTTNAQCDSMVFSYLPSSLTGDSSFTWVRIYVEGSDSLGGSGTGAINDFLINNTSANVTDTYKYIITAYGCSDSELVTVMVHPTPLLSSATSSLAVCSGQEFSYLPESLSGSAVTYSWIRDSVAGITPILASGTGSINEVLTNDSADLQIVTYSYTLLAYGCTNTENVYLTVNPLPVAPTITTYVTDVCDNAQNQNFGVTTPPSTGETYAWTATNASILAMGETGQYSLVNFTESGNATITITAMITSTGCTSSSSQNVTVGSGTANQPYVVYSFGEFVCLENNVTSYQWGYDSKATLDSTLLVGQINQNYANSNPDTVHNLYWVITGQNGCFMKSYYNGPASTAISNVNDVTDVTVYPNPTSNYINIDINSTVAGNVTIELSNMLGQKLNVVSTKENKAMMDVSNLASGVYVIDCYRDGVKTAAAKFIKN